MYNYNVPYKVLIFYIELVQVTEKDVQLIRFFYRIVMLAKIPRRTSN
jgi:hypothetical protein